MVRLLCALTGMAGLLTAGCAHEQAAGLRGFTWTYNQTQEEGAKLAYGLPSSDDVALMLTCKTGSGQVWLETHGRASEGLILASQGNTARLDAVAADGMPGASPLMAANLPASDRTLARFAATGRLQLIVNGHSAPLDAGSADRAQVKRFFAACGKA